MIFIDFLFMVIFVFDIMEFFSILIIKIDVLMVCISIFIFLINGDRGVSVGCWGICFDG